MNVRALLLPNLIRYDDRYAGALDCGRLRIAGCDAIAALWDFRVSGGACGEAEAAAFVAATSAAIETRLPLVTVLATGGTKLDEGMRALVGIPRMMIALDQLRDARLPHVSVADSPTTGGVWVGVGCSADLRAGVTGATVSFSGPRVVEAMTGSRPAPATGTADAAKRLGLLDAVMPAEEIPGWLGDALTALSVPAREPSDESGEIACIGGDGQELLQRLLLQPLHLTGSDSTVAAAIGRLDGQPVVGVALAAEAGALVGAGGFRLLARAATLADTIEAPLIALIDTLGGDPHDALVAPAIGEAMRAVLACRAPTIAVVHGAGGSGGALAGAVADRVLVGPDGWFAALAPTGAAAALRRDLDDVIDLLRLRPDQLLADGFADASYVTGQERRIITEELRKLAGEDPTGRLRRRHTRWSEPLRPRASQ